MDIQNNFNSKNNGNFSDKHVNNVPPMAPKEAVLCTMINQSDTKIRSTGNFNSKVTNS